MVADPIIEVKVLQTQLVRTPVVAKIAEEFAEWLEKQGFNIDHQAHDPRSYEELAKDFAEGCNGQLG